MVGPRVKNYVDDQNPYPARKDEFLILYEKLGIFIKRFGNKQFHNDEIIFIISEDYIIIIFKKEKFNIHRLLLN